MGYSPTCLASYELDNPFAESRAMQQPTRKPQVHFGTSPSHLDNLVVPSQKGTSKDKASSTLCCQHRPFLAAQFYQYLNLFIKKNCLQIKVTLTHLMRRNCILSFFEELHYHPLGNIPPGMTLYILYRVQPQYQKPILHRIRI